jgi:hypothetical protein
MDDTIERRFWESSQQLEGVNNMPKRKVTPKITKEEFLARLMSREPNREKVIKKILAELHAYEMKYGMRSEIFFKLFAGTPAEDQHDFLEWVMCYREYLQILQSQFNVERAAADVVG